LDKYEAVISGNITALEKHLSKRWNINKAIPQTYCTPLEIALTNNVFESIKWLVANGVDLNSDIGSRSFNIAVKYCSESTIRYLIENGAEVIPKTITRANHCPFHEALYGENDISIFSLIHSLGYTAKKHGGNILMLAMVDNNKPVINFFLQNGADVNFTPENDVFHTKGSTPICYAARFSDLEVCKALVEKGADVRVSEYGKTRPYHIALARGDMEMAAFFKSLEPAAFHSIENKLQELKPYKLPKALLDFLQSENLRLELRKKQNAISRECEYIEFLHLTDVIPIKACRRKVLLLSRVVENYESTVAIIWNTKDKMIAWYDEEHNEIGNIAPFDEFISNADDYITKALG